MLTAPVTLTDILNRCIALAAAAPTGSYAQRAVLRAAASVSSCLRAQGQVQDATELQALADDLAAMLGRIPNVSQAALAVSALRAAAEVARRVPETYEQAAIEARLREHAARNEVSR